MLTVCMVSNSSCFADDEYSYRILYRGKWTVPGMFFTHHMIVFAFCHRQHAPQKLLTFTYVFLISALVSTDRLIITSDIRDMQNL